MRLFDARTARVLATLLLFALILAFIGLAWKTLVTFLFAILFAYLLEPVIASMEKRFHMHRGLAVLVLYLVLGLLIVGFFLAIGPHIMRAAAQLSNVAPDLQQKLLSGEFVRRLGQQHGWSAEAQERVHRFLLQHQTTIMGWIQDLLRDLAGLAANAIWVALIPILAVFFLLSGERYSAAFLEQVARRRQRAFAATLFHDIHDVLASYIRAQIILTALGTGIYLTGFLLLRLPYAITVGVAAGMLEFIPVVGPLIGVIGIFLVAFLTGYHHLWLLAVFVGGQRLLQDYVNAPHIMGNQVQLNSLAVLFGVLAGGELGGIIGVYLSIPIMATVRVGWVRWREFRDSQSVVVPSAEPPTSGTILPPSQ